MLANRSRRLERIGEAAFYLACAVPAGCAVVLVIGLVCGYLVVDADTLGESLFQTSATVSFAEFFVFPIVVFAFSWLSAKVRHRGYVLFYAGWLVSFVLALRFIALWLD